MSKPVETTLLDHCPSVEDEAGLTMDVILHLGAHRTGSTSFQRYVRANHAKLSGQAIGFWGPGRTRNGLLHGIAECPASPEAAQRAAGRVALNLDKAARLGTGLLIVSDENMIGTTRRCLRARSLYPEVGVRMARLFDAFAPVKRVVLQIRSLDSWWASSVAYLVPRGEGIPDAAVFEQIAAAPRSWRHVITDLACACPDAEILVSPYERYGPRPDCLLSEMTGALYPPKARMGEFWANRRPQLPALRDLLSERGQDPALLPEGDGRWHPFSDIQAAQLREAYADDLFWLRAGADGLALLTEDPEPVKSAIQLVAGLDKEGRNDDGSTRRLAPTR